MLDSLTTDQQLKVIKLIGENRNVLVNVSKSKPNSREKRLTWMEIAQQCREEYDFDPTFGHDWKYLRQQIWHNMKLRALRRNESKRAAKILTEVDIEVLSILDGTVGNDDDVDSNGMVMLRDAEDDSFDTTDAIDTIDNKRTLSPDHASSRPEPIAKKPVKRQKTTHVANGEPPKVKVDNQRNFHLKNRIFEAELEMYKNQAESCKQQAEATKSQIELFKSQVESFKSQALFWKMKVEDMRSGVNLNDDDL